MERRLLDYLPDMELAPEAAPQPPAAAPALKEDAEMTFGADLLEVGGGAGLQALLAQLVASVGAADGRAPDPALGRALTAALARAAQAILPIRSGPAPARGPDLKTRAARVFGLELEGLSPEDKEFEVARHFVRFAADTVAHARQAGGAAGADPQTRVQAALRWSARRHAPGLLRQAAATPAHSGRWQRQGNRIVVLDC